MPEKGLGLTELIRRVGGDDAVEIQNLLDSLNGASERKHGVTELRVGTRRINTREIATGTSRKIALIVWLDRAAVAAALDAWQKEQADAPAPEGRGLE